MNTNKITYDAARDVFYTAWTPEELHILEHFGPVSDRKQLVSILRAKGFSRSSQAVKFKLWQLKINYQKRNLKQLKEWSAIEDEVLLRAWGKLSTRVIIDTFFKNRSRSNLNNRWNFLKNKYFKNWNIEDDYTLKLLSHKYEIELIQDEVLPCYSVEQIKARYYYLNLNNSLFI